MPIYEYRCTDCGNQFEKLVPSMTAQPAIACPDCGGQHVKKAISLFGASSGGATRGASAQAPAACAPSG